jgi:DNA polymerase/3'-5' exonuclease PolX
MNNIIIKEFEKLLLYIQKQIDNDNNTKDIFRYKHFQIVLNIIKKLDFEIKLDNLYKLKIPKIGKGTINRIEEILKNGYLLELKDFKQDDNEKIIQELELVVGIGRNKALELVNNGIKSINDLKKKIESRSIIVNDKILLGLKYHNKFFGNIPRQEISNIKKILDKIIDDMNKKRDDNNKYILKICGSYRRMKPFSGDIDILLTIKNSDVIDKYLVKFIKNLKKKIKLNNNNPLLVDDITDKNYETKYMGFCKYLDNPYRRIDIRFIPWKSYYTALLYFTGSAEHNKKLRTIALKKKYKLSEYNLIDLTTNTELKITSEKKIFELLDLDYVLPKFR